jgi:hypothetical protein
MSFIVDPNSGSVFLNFLAAWINTGPRLALLAIILHERAGRLRGSQVDASMPALNTLIGSKESVPIDQLAKICKGSDPIETMRTLTALDGVNAATDPELSLIVSPRLAQEFADWALEESR